MMYEYGYDVSQCSPVRRQITGVNQITNKAYGCTPWIKVSQEEYKYARIEMDRQQMQARIIARQETSTPCRNRDRWIEERYEPEKIQTTPRPRVNEEKHKPEQSPAPPSEPSESEKIRKRWASYPTPGEWITVVVYPDENGSWEVGGLGIKEEVRQLKVLEDFNQPEPIREKVLV